MDRSGNGLRKKRRFLFSLRARPAGNIDIGGPGGETSKGADEGKKTEVGFIRRKKTLPTFGDWPPMRYQLQRVAPFFTKGCVRIIFYILEAQDMARTWCHVEVARLAGTYDG